MKTIREGYESPADALAAIVGVLENVTERGGQYEACCPAHEDRDPSFAVALGDGGKVLMKCQAGCGFGAILQALSARLPHGLAASDLFPPGEKSRRKSRGQIVATYPYRDESGAVVSEVVRFDPKSFRQRRPDGNGGWVWKVKGVKPVLYRLPELLAADPADPIVVVEGEKDADALAARGFVATTNAGGAGKWKDALNAPLAGREVVVCPDFDGKADKDPGGDHARDVAARLAGVAGSVRMVGTLGERPDGTPVKDPAEYFDRGGDADRFRAILAEAGPPDLSPAKSAGAASTPAVIREHSNEADARELSNEADAVPDAARFVAEEATEPRSGLPRLRHHRGEFHHYRGGAYRPVSDDDLDAMVWRHLDRHYRNLTRSVVGNTTAALKAEVKIPDGKDAPCWLGDPRDAGRFLAFKNGLLNADAADAGGATLQPHTPEWFSPIVLPFDYDPAATCPTWDRIVRANLEDDAERIALLQEWFGYVLLPGTGEQKFLFLFGDGGTGKSVTLASMMGVVGRRSCSNVALERFGERFALWGTRGKLLNAVAEIGEIDKVAEGELKKYTAGDPLEFEQKHKDSVYELPTARCVFSTNNLPRFTDRTDGVWRRLLVVPFERKVPDAERVKGMDKAEWWADSGELPGIFNWAMEGRRRLRDHGWTAAAASQKALDDYRADCNPAGQFLAEHYRKHEHGAEPKSEVYAAYRAWVMENGYRPLSEGPFGKEVFRQFPGVTAQRPRIEGRRVQVYAGLTKGGDDEDYDEWA